MKNGLYNKKKIANYNIVSLADRYDLFEQQNEISDEVWPEFILHDSVTVSHWMLFINTFKKCQLLIMDETEILAIINTVPLHFDGDINKLPDEGWSWGIKKSISDYDAGIEPNILMGVQIVINKKYQGKGLSSIGVREMSKLAMKNGFERLIVPVRPSNKHNYPLIPMEDYIMWKKDHSLPFDNWLRVHIKTGGKMIKICSQSMYVSGSIDEWKEWTELDFPGSGSYIIPGALNPISIDTSKNQGIYIEPNVWVLHNVERENTSEFV